MHILHLLHQHRQMTENEFIEKYNSDNFESYVIENATIDYWNDLIKTYKIERLNLSSITIMMFAFNHEIKEGKNLLGKEFDGFCERQIEILKIENLYKPQQIKPSKITDIQKDQIFAEMVFEKGLYYFSDTHKSKIQQAYKNLENDFETKEDFIRAVNRLLHSNGLHFYSRLRTIPNETEFIKYIQSQYDLYNEYTPNNSFKWLNFTKKSIMYGFGILRIDNDSLKASFMNWYNETKKTITPEAPQQSKAVITNEIKIIDKLKQNKFDDVEPSKVYQHFKQLVDNKYITNENFNLFLSTVFEQNKTLTTKIEIIKPNSKQRVQKIFYSYFEKFAQNKYGTKQTYIDLLCNNFTGFNSKTLSTNFAK